MSEHSEEINKKAFSQSQNNQPQSKPEDTTLQDETQPQDETQQETSEAAPSLEQERLSDLSPDTSEANSDAALIPDAAALPAALEALLFVAGDPLPLEKLAAITGFDRQTISQVLTGMSERYQHDTRRGLLLREIEGRYMLCTKPDQKAVLQKLFQPRNRPPLSQAAYETLAIIAYNQPVTRAQVETVRGVNSDSIISRLQERNLIHEAGTLDAPGRPSLFETTDQFLMDFGLRSVEALPPMEMLMYGTLRDFETSLEEAAGRRDRQISIDQIVSAFVPDHSPDKADSPVQPEKKGNETGSRRSDHQADQADDMPDSEVLDVSEALFGQPSDND